MSAKLAVVLLPLTILLASCHNQRATPPTASPITSEKLTLTLSSPAFVDGAQLPVAYTCEGKNVSPPLHWSGVPRPAVTLTLVCEDPDAPGGTWTHWVLYNMPANQGELHAAVPGQATLPNGALQGRNDFNKTGYGGACPPSGPAHRYVFKLYALDTRLALAAGSTKQKVLDAMQGHILAEGELTGKYARR